MRGVGLCVWGGALSEMRPYLGDLHVLALVVLAEEIEEAVELAVREVLRAHALRPVSYTHLTLPTKA